jgi:hypothetical protein
MRSYIVIPEGTSIVHVRASTPHFAASKAKRGKGEVINVKEAAVLPQSSAVEIVTDDGPAHIPGQLSWGDLQE